MDRQALTAHWAIKAPLVRPAVPARPAIPVRRDRKAQQALLVPAMQARARLAPRVGRRARLDRVA